MKKNQIKNWKNQEIKNFFKSILLFFTIILSFAGTISMILLASSTKIDSDDFYHVLMTSPHGFTDSGFNQGSIEGICEANESKFSPTDLCNYQKPYFRKKISYGYAGTSINSEKILEHVLNVYRTRGVKNFIVPGFTFSTFLNEHIKELKKYGIKIIAVDTYAFAGVKKDKWPSNLYQFTFLHYFAGYHAGLYAGAYAFKHSSKFKDGDSSIAGKQIKFASIVGLDINPIFNYVIGFKLGLEQISKIKNKFKDNAETEETVELWHSDFQTIGGFNPVEFGDRTQKMAKNLYKSGVSVIFVVAGPLSKVVNSAAKIIEKQSNNKKHLTIGVDADQGVIFFNQDSKIVSNEDSYIMITSAVINLRSVIKTMIDKVKNLKPGNFYVSGHYVFTNSSGEIENSKDCSTTDDLFGSIPQRFTKTELWKTIIKETKKERNCDLLTILNKIGKNDSPNYDGEKFPELKAGIIEKKSHFIDWVIRKVLDLSKTEDQREKSLTKFIELLEKKDDFLNGLKKLNKKMDYPKKLTNDNDEEEEAKAEEN